MKNTYSLKSKTLLFILITLSLNIATKGQSPNDGYNLIKNGAFEPNLSNWGLWKNTNAGFNATHHSATGNKHSGNRSAKVKISSVGNTSNPYKVHFYNHGGIEVKSGHSYQASVWIKSSGPNATAKITFRKNSSPYTEYAAKTIDLNTSWTMYSLVWDGNTSSTNNVRFTVELGSHTGTVFIDDAIITNCTRPSTYKTLQSSIIGNGRIKMQTSMGTTECLKLGNNSFQQGKQVTLTAIAEPGYTFHKWGGASTSTSSTCNITIDSNSHINAYYKKTSTVDVDIHYRNKVDWSIAGYDGTIPYVTTNVIDMTKPPYNCNKNGGQGTHNYNQIKTALATAGNSWTVLYFPPGTYKIKGNTPLKIPNNTVLRGECPNSTTLKLDFNGLNDKNKGCLEIRGGNKNNKKRVYSGAHLNSHQISIKDSGPYKVNDFIEITQENDSKFLDWSQAWGNRQVGEIAKITGKSGNTLFLDRGLHYTYNPHKKVEVKKITMTQNAGIENLKVYRVDKSESWNIFIVQAYNSWVRNIESKKTYIGHIGMRSSYRCEMRESYINDSYSFGSNKRGYGIQIDNQSTSNLIEDNIFYKLRHAMLLQVGPNGNVLGFNYSRKNIGQYPAGGTYNKKSNISLHGDYPFMNLFESNDVQFIYSGDHKTGSGVGNTFFRNRTNEKINGGWRGGILVKEGSHYHNIIANEVTNWTVTTSLSNKIIIASSCKNTNQHSNYYKRYGSYKIDNDKRHTLKKSLYQHNGNFNFPYPLENMGLQLPYKAHQIKSKDRFNGSQANAPCLDPCENSSDTTELTQCGNNINIQAPTYDNKHVLHGVKIKGFSNSPGGGIEGKPELYIELFKNNSMIFQSNRSKNETGNPPKYISCGNIVLDPNATYKVEIWDYDWHNSDDFLGSVTFQGGTSSLNHNNGSNKIKLNKTIYKPAYNWSNGATTSSTTITQSGLASVTVTKPDGCESKHNYMIQLNQSPKITAQPSHQANCLGSAANPISISATGGFSLSYQWYTNSLNSFSGGTPISGANSPNYTPTTNIVGTEYLWCIVSDKTNSNCDPDTSKIVHSLVFDAVYITQQPLDSQTVCQNGTASTLNVHYGSNPLNPNPIGLDVDWFLALGPNSPISSSTYVGAGFSFTPPSDSIGTFYYYYVAKSEYYTGPCFEVMSNLATVTVIAQPTIASQTPSYQSVCQNTQATPLNIAINGPNNIYSYTWVSSTNPSGLTPTANLIPGANGSSYSPPTHTPGTYYYNTIVNLNAYGCNNLSSGFYTVDVKESPMIYGEPSNYANWRQTVCLGATANIITAHGNSGNYAHQWYHNTTNSFTGATPIPGATLDNYIPNGYPVGNHYFFCVKTDLSVNACPPCTTQAYSLTVINSATANFNYNIFGSNVSFQNISPYATSSYWDFGDGTNSTSQSPTHYYNDGQYTVTLIVNTPCGPDTLSQSFTINTQNHIIDKEEEKPRGGKKGNLGKNNGGIAKDSPRIKIFPNPIVNQKQFNISVSSTDLGSIKIFDSMSSCVLTQTLTSNPSSINISQLSKGVYAILWQNNKSSISKQLIIQ